MGKTVKDRLAEDKERKELEHFDRDKTIDLMLNLSQVLSTMIIDEDVKIMEESKYTNAFDEIERGLIKQKILKLLKEL